MTTTLANNLVHAFEVYRPDGDRLSALNDANNSYGHGEGAVGYAWAEGVPVFEHGDEGHTTLAIPSLREQECRGVIALHCRESEGLCGAFEVWRRNERGELGIDKGWYPGLQRLEQVSRYIKFPRRAGLPGRVWDDRFPRVLGGLEDSKNFVRVAAARSERLGSALGVPFMGKPPELDAVLLMLNTRERPIARAMEVWSRDLATGQLKIVSADYGPHAELAAESRRLTLRLGEGIAGHVYRDLVPWSTSDLLGFEFPRGERFANAGLTSGLGFPVFIGADLVACVNLYL
ncbi:hypothetical protein MalM25_17540 [Planctomycetes bacterium MalM25]|nr:hypothetical protein MalM25_17540 [Planctomycetes bacterium MalM25]